MDALQRLVYVEDEPDIQEVVRIALEMIGGLQVTLFSSGPQAIAGAAGAAPQLLLLDVMMPEMDGPTTLQHLRAQPSLRHVPAVFMTAKARADEIAELLAVGAVGVIAKPFDPMTLADELRALWAKAEAPQIP